MAFDEAFDEAFAVFNYPVSSEISAVVLSSLLNLSAPVAFGSTVAMTGGLGIALASTVFSLSSDPSSVTGVSLDLN